MKKLLTILGAIMIGSSSVITVMSCTPPKKADTQKPNKKPVELTEDQILDVYLSEIAKIAYLNKEKGYDAKYLFENFVAKSTIKDPHFIEANAGKPDGIKNFKQLQDKYFAKNVFKKGVFKNGTQPDQKPSYILDMISMVIGMGSNPEAFQGLAQLLPQFLPMLSNLNLGNNNIVKQIEKILTPEILKVLDSSLGNDKYLGKSFQEAIDMSMVPFLNAMNKILGYKDVIDAKAPNAKELVLKSFAKNLGEFIKAGKKFNLSIDKNFNEILAIIDFAKLFLIYIDKIMDQPAGMNWTQLQSILNAKIDKNFLNGVDIKKIFNNILPAEKLQNLMKGLFWGKEKYVKLADNLFGLLGLLGGFENSDFAKQNFDKDHYNEVGFNPILKVLFEALLPDMGSMINGMLGIIVTNSPIVPADLAKMVSGMAPGILLAKLPKTLPDSVKNILKDALSNPKFYTEPWDFLMSPDFMALLKAKPKNPEPPLPETMEKAVADELAKVNEINTRAEAEKYKKDLKKDKIANVEITIEYKTPTAAAPVGSFEVVFTPTADGKYKTAKPIKSKKNIINFDDKQIIQAKFAKVIKKELDRVNEIKTHSEAGQYKKLKDKIKIDGVDIDINFSAPKKEKDGLFQVTFKPSWINSVYEGAQAISSSKITIKYDEAYAIKEEFNKKFADAIDSVQEMTTDAEIQKYLKEAAEFKNDKDVDFKTDYKPANAISEGSFQVTITPKSGGKYKGIQPLISVKTVVKSIFAETVDKYIVGADAIKTHAMADKYQKDVASKKINIEDVEIKVNHIKPSAVSDSSFQVTFAPTTNGKYKGAKPISSKLNDLSTIEDLLLKPIKKLFGVEQILKYGIPDNESIQSIIDKIGKAEGNLKLDFNNLRNVLKGLPDILKLIKGQSKDLVALGLKGGKIIAGSPLDGLQKVIADLSGIVSIQKQLEPNKKIYADQQAAIGKKMQAELNEIKISKTEFVDNYHVFTLENGKKVKIKISSVEKLKQVEEIQIV
ncbi:hypothetical protein [Williamsoniiplasma luminosum]|uniref:Lipoprotein n=1 Tax=Williamsoniiplasma luminosum TaxID=214888 RepID=A0A2S0NL32_9MOLU|nr:hypothetical protein [Williamsoniiplasma luminosum]AVP49731.1 MAG: hypothetical protein C5T88_04120 [Williamsoniiplasma luminosum]